MDTQESTVLINVFLFITPDITLTKLRKVSKSWNYFATSKALWKKYVEMYLYYQIHEYESKDGTKEFEYDWYSIFPELLSSSFQWRRAIR